VPTSTPEVASQPLPIAEPIVTKSSPKKSKTSINISTKSPESKPPESFADATLRPHRSAKDKSYKDGPAKMRGLWTEVRDESEVVRCYCMTIKKALKDRDELKMTEQAIHKELRQLLEGDCLVPRRYNKLSKRDRRSIVIFTFSLRISTYPMVHLIIERLG
jgi:hypothetical protein